MRLLDELTRDDLRVAAAQSLLVLPVGATEQHGPHLPVGTDRFAVEYIARAAALEAAEQIPVLVAPTLPFGSSHHHLPFGGTLSLSSETYYRALCELVESLVISGFQRIFILNGHGGNSELLQLVARDMALKHPVAVATAPYWQIAWEALVAEEAHVRAGLPGHAGAFETALVLALRAELVREPRPHRAAPADTDPRGMNRYRAEIHGAWRAIDGFTDSPDQADAERGARYLALITQAVAAAFVEFYQSAAR